MDTKYYYSASRIKSLESTLLTEVQLERLLGAKDQQEAYKVMHDTFLAPYISDPRKTNLSRAFRKCMTLTKDLIAEIAPEPELVDFLWIRYDYYNLETIVKGKKANLPEEEIIEKCYFAGKHDPEQLLAYAGKGDLYHIDWNFQKAYDRAMKAQEVYEIDIIMNLAYFETMFQWLDNTKNAFVREYVKTGVDLYNLKTQLRLLNLADAISLPNVFAPGGTISKEQMTTQEQIFEGLKRFGGSAHWKEALDEYSKNGHFSMIEKASDDYVVMFLKEKSVNIFSPATLFAFFRARKNNIDVIKTIMVAKEGGISEGELRFMLRRLYV
jgi:V/A-type H+-transporting ATPase subunit C